MEPDESYRQVAKKTLTSGESGDTPVVAFIASTFELADDFTKLEANLADHELAWHGLRANGLADLDDQFRSLTDRYANIQRTVSDPTKLEQHCSTGDNVNEDDATRLRTAIHAHGDLDRVLDQISDTQTRVGNDITAKRNHLTTISRPKFGFFDSP